MAQRRIIEIDEEKCDGCGQCVSACAEGAIEIRGGKARLVAENYCDGLGACLGECPRDAIRIVEREADAFSEESVHKRLACLEKKPALPVFPGGCPGTAVRSLPLRNAIGPRRDIRHAKPGGNLPEEQSALTHWPVQLRLVPPHAPFLRGADVLLVADCVPFAMADFHQRLLRGHPVVIGCPKLDDGQAHVEKLAAMIVAAELQSITIVHMEVPCCTGLVRIAEAAVNRSGRSLPLEQVTISVGGEVMPGFDSSLRHAGRSTTAAKGGSVSANE